MKTKEVTAGLNEVEEKDAIILKSIRESCIDLIDALNAGNWHSVLTREMTDLEEDISDLKLDVRKKLQRLFTKAEKQLTSTQSIFKQMIKIIKGL
jgi:hypothetical protein